MIRTDGNISELSEIRDVLIVTARHKERDNYFHAVVGKRYEASRCVVTQIIWNKNWLLEHGISRWEIWAKKDGQSTDCIWKTFDNPVSVSVTSELN